MDGARTPASGELRRPIWLVRPVNPVLDAYTLPDDQRTAAARERDPGNVPSAHDFADLVDRDPEAVWGSMDAKADECSS